MSGSCIMHERDEKCIQNFSQKEEHKLQMLKYVMLRIWNRERYNGQVRSPNVGIVKSRRLQ